MNKIELRYGVMFDKLEKQANEQGYTLEDKADAFQKRRDAIATLMFGDILTDSQIDKAYQKLHKQVLKSLKPLNKE